MIRSSALAGATLALLAATATAQGRHVFDVESSQSSFTFSGNVSYMGISGPLVGQPNTFDLSGAVSADLTVAGGALTAAQLVPGNTVAEVPPLRAIVPNPIPFLPPLATIDVTMTEVVFSSVDPVTMAPAPFVVGSGGAFSTHVSAQILSGSATVNAAGTTQTFPLAGASSPPQMVAGSLVSRPDGFRLQVGLQTNFSFNDPGSGVSGTLSLNGNVLADDRFLATDVEGISLATGGVQTLTLSAGSAQTGRTYLLLGSTSGTQPGFTVGSVVIPLNPDPYFVQSAAAPNSPPLGNSFAALDPLGVARATFAIPPLRIPALVGLRLDHAYLVISGTTGVLASNPVPLTFRQ